MQENTDPQKKGKPRRELNKAGVFIRTGRDWNRWEGSCSISEGREFFPRIAKCLEYVGREEEGKGEVGRATKATIIINYIQEGSGSLVPEEGIKGKPFFLGVYHGSEFLAKETNSS